MTQMHLKLVSLCALLLVPALAHAGVPPNQYVYLEALGGVMIPTAATDSVQVPVGGGLGFRTSPSLAWGGFIQSSASTITVVSTEVTARTDIYGAQLTYYFDQEREFTGGLNIGLKTGFLYRRATSLSTTLGVPISEATGATGWVLGPKIGFEQTYDIGVAMGIEGIVYYSPANSISAPIQIFATLKAWF